jgi:hypothetical protein
MTPLVPQRSGGVASTRARIGWFMLAYKTALLTLVLVFLFGCASPDLPTPRHAIVPMAVTDLSARQVGDTIVLTFTLPTTSTDQQPLADVPSIEIYRNKPQPSVSALKGRANNKIAEQLADTVPSETIGQYERDGRIEFPDRLNPSELSNETGADFIYVVRTRVSRAKASADSNTVALRVYPPPAEAQNVRAQMTPTAVTLDWSTAPEQGRDSIATPAGFRIYRGEVDPTTADVAVLNPSEAKLIAPEQLLALTTATHYADANFQFGHTYVYRVREVVQFGNEAVESADSAPAVLTAKDIFAPAPPQGLEAIVVPKTNGTPVSIELTWTINSEPDLAGYNVYRSEEAETPGQKLNSELLLAPTFRDMSVTPGKRYFYRVGAVDQSGNESPRSLVVETHVPE